MKSKPATHIVYTFIIPSKKSLLKLTVETDITRLNKTAGNQSHVTGSFVATDEEVKILRGQCRRRS